MIRLEGLEKVYGGKGGASHHALKGIDLSIGKGEIFGIIGRSGAGKSTLIRTINRLEEVTRGRVVVDGVDIGTLTVAELTAFRRQVGMVFQHFNLLSSRTVFGNVALPLELAGVSKAEIAARVQPMLELVGLDDKRDRYPSELSGGQKQRVGIARALVAEPKVLLCDEVTSALDPETTQQILDLLRDLSRRLGLTMVVITHEMSVVRDLCDRVAVIDDGLIVEQGNVFDVFVSPRHETTQALIAGEIEASLPKSLKRIINNGPPRDGENPVVKIVFTGPNAYDPIISQLSRVSGIDFNILAGQVDYIQNRPFGILFVEAKGGLAEAEKAIAFVQSRNLKAEIIGHVDPDAVPLG
ncbi:DL-methionine transporter subunit; ATP-binding component of ABC superfamily [uncultured Alphaproteobacteria bacterium]|uniref:Cell division ATP-binding protein FtsE n=1 Tax=uncultured Alphaproteobacteria bacterium TaxID=91750 RepID=A0A212KMG3_9PROT|nr:DL-methionine transporter subunit; ATP-binding component of ABC superfamily [uncultured Alphaproteobacteria bacterium]